MFSKHRWPTQRCHMKNWTRSINTYTRLITPIAPLNNNNFPFNIDTNLLYGPLRYSLDRGCTRFKLWLTNDSSWVIRRDLSDLHGCDALRQCPPIPFSKGGSYNESRAVQVQEMSAKYEKHQDRMTCKLDNAYWGVVKVLIDAFNQFLA